MSNNLSKQSCKYLNLVTKNSLFIFKETRRNKRLFKVTMFKYKILKSDETKALSLNFKKGLKSGGRTGKNFNNNQFKQILFLIKKFKKLNLFLKKDNFL